MYPFYFSQLSARAQMAYKKIHESLLKEQCVISVDLSGLTAYDISKILRAILDDNPQIYLQNGGSYSYCWTNSCFEIKAPVASCYAREDEKRFLQSFKKMVEKRCSTEYEIEKYIHDFIINTVKFDHDETDGKRHEHSNHTSVGGLLTGKSVCEGIARLAQLLFQECGLKAIYCPGSIIRDDRDEKDCGHAWTVVSINGRWYHIDVSHDVCLSVDKSRKEYRYFNLTQDEIKADHRLDFEESFKALNINTDRHNYYKYNGYYFESWDDFQEKLRAILNQDIKRQQASRVFQFKMSKQLIKECNIDWSNLAVGVIGRILDGIEERNPNVGVGFDPPSGAEKLGVMSVSFNFAYA